LNYVFSVFFLIKPCVLDNYNFPFKKKTILFHYIKKEINKQENRVLIKKIYFSSLIDQMIEIFMNIYFNDFNFYIKKHVANIKYIYYFVKTKNNVLMKIHLLKNIFFQNLVNFSP